ncbi:alpha/beta fold hydrolase [Methylobacterium sp. WL69]|nr:alpha/beta fold hydrolase [Methylobacterium sp. WL69]
MDVNVHVAGPADGPTVLLLHGWPDDATTWATVAGHLNEAGFRTVTPELRGFGGTRFRSADTPRTGNSGILAYDAIDLMCPSSDDLGHSAVFRSGGSGPSGVRG